jgi:hypothetical protein
VVCVVLSTQQPNVSPERQLQTFRVPGNIFTHTITGLYKDTVYNVSVAAGTVNSFAGPSAWKVINTGEGLSYMHAIAARTFPPRFLYTHPIST